MLFRSGLKPDLTLLLDLAVDTGLARAHGRGPKDRIEMENIDFFERVRATYRERAEAEPKRFRLIDSGKPLPDVLVQVERAVAAFLEERGLDERGLGENQASKPT